MDSHESFPAQLESINSLALSLLCGVMGTGGQFTWVMETKNTEEKKCTPCLSGLSLVVSAAKILLGPPKAV